MHKHQNIKALFFLVIFSMLLLHQVVPHWHHQHQEEHQHSEVAHSHNHKHHHEKPEKDNSKNGFFDWFTDMHIHTNVTTDVLVLRQETAKKITLEKGAVKTLLAEIVELTTLEEETFIENGYHPPDNLQNTYFPNCSLRGPPSLG
ncbi:hypothetical protein [Planktosalinus lacus]|uniref:Uncharacterized protein n=1 Tax=Planktosalinus lacus TaxID=1526573 RepID=A0A8J2VAY5_9FLAO|nr:hypothetical protein [Planktosalinus lacus]GGD96779.1 hypothetical protein GCM10011312_20380 [Planktosalinus lacus]